MTTKFPLHKIFRAQLGDEAKFPRFDITKLFSENPDLDVPLSVPVRPPFPTIWLEQQTVSQSGEPLSLGAWITEEVGLGVHIKAFGKDAPNGFYTVPFSHTLYTDNYWVVTSSLTAPEPDAAQEIMHKTFPDAFEKVPEDELWKVFDFLRDRLQEKNISQAEYFWQISQDQTLSKDIQYRFQGLSFLASVVDKVDFMLRLMNVKNIEVVEVGGGVIKRRHRRGQNTERHYTLRIRPGSFRNSRGDTQPSGAKNAYHIARGHFKTYTADAPLLGKHVGTWWWPAHARGSKSAGTVTKDYDVRLPKGGEEESDDK